MQACITLVQAVYRRIPGWQKILIYLLWLLAQEVK
jgi:hypothetical protein